MAHTILLLEDDALLAETIKEMLEENGYGVDLAENGDEAAELAYAKSYDLYIFDVNVPEINGFELLKALRDASDKTATLFMSAMVDIKSISKGFELGAQDYLKKPFYPEELLIRVKAKLSVPDALFVCGDFSYDAKKNVFEKAGKRLVLGEVQQRLFQEFYRNHSRVVDKELLLECLGHPSPTALRVAINKLKQTTGLPIENVRGVGYVLEAC
jgi:DNA-binding response OmpR family regulator